MQVMYKVLRAALKIEGLESAKINNYQLHLNGKIYQVSDLEKLPFPIRPSTLSSPKSDSTMVFFTRHSFLSTFKIGDDTFHSMEHYLAVQKASLSGKPAMISKALKVKNPVQAKHLLNTLKSDHVKEWDEQVATIALQGLRAKFNQNKSLGDKLCATGPLVLGEASTNPWWGIGLDLNDPDGLDKTKWSDNGNLLGRSLMEVWQELLSMRNRTP